MPLVRFNILQGSDAEIAKPLDAANEAVVEAFQVPQGTATRSSRSVSLVVCTHTMPGSTYLVPMS